MPNTVGGIANNVASYADLSLFAVLSGWQPGESASDTLNDVLGADENSLTYANGEDLALVATVVFGPAAGTLRALGTTKIASSAERLAKVNQTAANAGAHVDPSVGQKLYRVYGGDSKAGGASWSPIDPRTVGNYRDAAGLPSGGASGVANTGRFVIEGTLNDPAAVVLQRSALPLDGMKGGLPEYIVPNWLESGSISIRRVSGVNPEF